VQTLKNHNLSYSYPIWVSQFLLCSCWCLINKNMKHAMFYQKINYLYLSCLFLNKLKKFITWVWFVLKIWFQFFSFVLTCTIWEKYWMYSDLARNRTLWFILFKCFYNHRWLVIFVQDVLLVQMLWNFYCSLLGTCISYCKFCRIHCAVLLGVR
jgi:hypothetical protein